MWSPCTATCSLTRQTTDVKRSWFTVPLQKAVTKHGSSTRRTLFSRYNACALQNKFGTPQPTNPRHACWITPPVEWSFAISPAFSPIFLSFPPQNFILHRNMSCNWVSRRTSLGRGIEGHLGPGTTVTGQRNEARLSPQIDHAFPAQSPR